MSTRTERYHHGDLRRTLVRAALRIVARRGGDRLTIREAARMAGVSHNAPYRHFANIGALREAVAEAGFLPLGAALAAASKKAPPLKRRGAIGRAYIDFAVSNPNLHQLMFSREIVRSRTPSRVEAGAGAFAILLETLKDGGDSGRAGALRAWALAHGLAALIRDGHLAGDDPVLNELLGPRLGQRRVSRRK